MNKCVDRFWRQRNWWQ